MTLIAWFMVTVVFHARTSNGYVNISYILVNMVKTQSSVPKPPIRRVRIGVLAYDGCMGTQLFAIADVFRIAQDLARPSARHPPIEVQVETVAVGLRPGAVVEVAGGLSIRAQRPKGRYDLLIVPGLEINRNVDWDAKLALYGRELRFMRRAFAKGVSIACVCVGAFLLGEAGLLDGRRVTTAWLFAQDFERRYTAALLQSDAILVEDGAIISTGAVSSAFDLAIHLVKRLWGAAQATATARVCLLPSPRVSQSPYVDTSLMTGRLPRFSEQLAQWFELRITEAFDLARIARAFHVSPSTLMRRVKSETGQSPLSLLQRLRVEKAKQLLCSTDWSLLRITEAVGYCDVVSFSRLFARLVGETPAQYRRR